VSVSLGLSAVFLFGGLRRADPPRRIPLAHGDVVVWGGPARLRYHGVLPLEQGQHPGRRPDSMDRRRLLRRLDGAWGAFKASYGGLSDAQLMKPGVTGAWSIRDILAHVTTWEEEALTHLPLILEGGTPPRYSVRYGGLEAFNARMTEQKASLSLATVRRKLDETHRRLIDVIQQTPEDQLSSESRFRRCLRLDAYGHYPLHAEAIRQWQQKSLV
jgi:hypothetical protein